jgi:hypothetical protein
MGKKDVITPPILSIGTGWRRVLSVTLPFEEGSEYQLQHNLGLGRSSTLSYQLLCAFRATAVIQSIVINYIEVLSDCLTSPCY